MESISEFVKALSNTDRLRIIGLLTQTPANLGEIVTRLNLPAREVIRHLEFLEQTGIIANEQGVYQLDSDKLATLGRDHLMHERISYIPAPNVDDESKRILKAYLNPDGSIKQLPTQPAKLQIVLNHLLEAFEVNTNYSEKEVNNVIRRFHEDTAGLRRDLVDRGMLQRESDGSRYWRGR